MPSNCKKAVQYVPMTPGGTLCLHLASDSKKEAWDKLLVDAAHMPYQTKEGFEARGYTVVVLLADEDDEP